jgi:hypothetical protein
MPHPSPPRAEHRTSGPASAIVRQANAQQRAIPHRSHLATLPPMLLGQK